MRFNVYHRGSWRASFARRYDAMVYVVAHSLGDDFEILDGSDEVA